MDRRHPVVPLRRSGKACSSPTVLPPRRTRRACGCSLFGAFNRVFSRAFQRSLSIALCGRRRSSDDCDQIVQDIPASGTSSISDRARTSRAFCTDQRRPELHHLDIAESESYVRRRWVDTDRGSNSFKTRMAACTSLISLACSDPETAFPDMARLALQILRSMITAQLKSVSYRIMMRPRVLQGCSATYLMPIVKVLSAHASLKGFKHMYAGSSRIRAERKGWKR